MVVMSLSSLPKSVLLSLVAEQCGKSGAKVRYGGLDSEETALLGKRYSEQPFMKQDSDPRH